MNQHTFSNYFLRSLVAFFILPALLSAAQTTAYAASLPNVSPKVSDDARTIKVICTLSSDNSRLELSKVRIFDGGEFIDSITFQNDGIFESIIFSDIDSITLQGDSDAKGYIQTKLLSRNKHSLKPVINMRLAQNNNILKLQGLDKKSNKVNIEMNKCKVVKFITP